PSTATATTANDPQILRGRLKKFVGAVWPAASITVAGIICINYSGSHRDQAAFRSLFLSHIGVALISAGIVGVGYELRASRKHMEEQVNRLIAINSDEAKRRFPATLQALFRDANKKDLTHQLIRERLQTIVDDITAIESNNLAANSVSVHFVSTLLDHTSKIAKVLAEAKPAGGAYDLKLPTPSALADDILSQQMLALRSGDSYRVISDFTTWDNSNLDVFWAATKRKVKQRNIVVSRVFCLYSYDRGLSRQKIVEILHSHWKVAAASKNYQLAVNTDSVDVHPHMGSFKYRGQTICFEPGPGGDLSEISFSRTEKPARFDRCFDKAVPAIDPKGERSDVTFDNFLVRIERSKPGWLPAVTSGPSGQVAGVVY
ncbi:MAG: hypothetical protein ABI779_27355, partial [Acidobacteriota bacterium]